MALELGLDGDLMATIKFKSGADYAARFSQLAEREIDTVCGKAIYPGAAVLYAEVQAGIDSLPTDEGYGTKDAPKSGLKAVQKEGLKRSLGIAKMQDKDGFRNVKVGFDGYNAIKTKRWPQGQPNQMVARSIERGTSFLRATPFMKQAISRAKKPATAAMNEAFIAAMKEFIEEG